MYYIYFILYFSSCSTQRDVSLANLLFPSGTNGLTSENLILYQSQGI